MILTKVGIVLVLTDFFESSDGMGTKLIGNVGGGGAQPRGVYATWGRLYSLLVITLPGAKQETQQQQHAT